MACEVGSAGAKLGWIEWVRALGSCAVVLLHVLGTTGLQVALGPTRSLLYTLVSVTLCRWAVPAFFMVSGFLLLDPAKDVTWHRVGTYVRRMVVVLLTFGFAFALMEEGYNAYAAGGGISAGLVLRAAADVVTTRTWDHLWYVYALVGVYLLLPALRTVRAHLGQRGFSLFAVALFVLLLVVPTLVGGWRLLLGVEGTFAGNALTDFLRNLSIAVTCFCLGGCLRGWRLGWPVVVLGIGSLAAMVGTSVWAILCADRDPGVIYLHGSCFATLYALLVVMLVRRAAGNADPCPRVAALARDSFGIYVIHPLFVHFILLIVGLPPWPPVLYELGFFAVVLGASILATRGLRRVPVLGGVL